MNSIHNISQENIINNFNTTPESLNPQSSAMGKNTPINIENQPCCLKKTGKIKGKKYGHYPENKRNMVVTEIRQHRQPVRITAERHNIPPRTIYTWLNRPDINDQRHTLADTNVQLHTIEKFIATEIRKGEDFLKQALKNNLLIQKLAYDFTQQPSNVARSNLQYLVVNKGDDPTKNTVHCAICDDLNLYNLYVGHTGETVDFYQLATNIDYSYHVQQRHSTAYRLIGMLIADNENILQHLKHAYYLHVMANTLATPASD